MSVLSTDTFSSNEAIFSYSSKMFVFSDICFSMILATEDVLQFYRNVRLDGSV